MRKAPVRYAVTAALAALAALRDVSVPALISDVIFILGWIGNRLSVETKCVRER